VLTRSSEGPFYVAVKRGAVVGAKLRNRDGHDSVVDCGPLRTVNFAWSPDATLSHAVNALRCRGLHSYDRTLNLD